MATYKKFLLVHPEPCIRNILELLIKDTQAEVDFEHASSLLEVRKRSYDLIIAHMNDVRPGSADVRALQDLRKEPNAWLGAFIGLAFSTHGAHRVFSQDERHPVIQYFFQIRQLKSAIHEKKGISTTEQYMFWRRVFCDKAYVKSEASLMIHEAIKGKWATVLSCLENLEHCVGNQQLHLFKKIRQYTEKKITDEQLWEKLLSPLLEGTYA